MKRIIAVLLIFSLSVCGLFGQTVPTDSVLILSKAQSDADRFKLNDTDLKAFRKHRAAYMAKYNGQPNPFLGVPFPKLPVLANPQDIHQVHLNYNKVDYYSAYFKPTIATTADTSLLKDSVYVRAFRAQAYKNTINRHPAIHYIGIGVAVAGAVGLVILVSKIIASMGN